MRLTIALPSKGRLREKNLNLLQQAAYNLNLPQDGRGYKAQAQDTIEDNHLDILFLSASEIARELGRGNISLGVTGEDLIRETVSKSDEKLQIELPLGFGQADVVVAVPTSWHDVDCMADLDDVAADFRHSHGRRLRIATKYWRLTQQFFSGKHGIGVYRIVESLGATEGTPAAGSADIIVDITSTGSTLAANWLKILNDGVILRSQACLISARYPHNVTPQDDDNHRQRIANLRSRLAKIV